MRAMTALIKREYLEHRGAFLYAPGILLAIASVAIFLAVATGHTHFDLNARQMPTGVGIFQASVGIVFFLWSIYLLIGLLFYFADSFSADRRNNALLFWKSMPQSDFKILTSKALSGLTIFLGLVFGFALVMAFLLYLVLLIVSTQHSLIAAPGLFEAVQSYVQMAIVGIVYFVLTLLWHAPGLAWVAGLSTVFQRWSIPLAFLIPGAVVLLEYLYTIRGSSRPIADFLSWRFQGIPNEADAIAILLGQVEGGPFAVIGLIFADINWLHMGFGLIFTTAIIYAASEYRRRRIDA